MSRLMCVVGAGLLALASGCGGSPIDTQLPPVNPNPTPTKPSPTSIKVRIDNVTPFQFSKSGVFNTPVGATQPGPLLPGDSYKFTFTAGKNQTLRFAVMFGQSNDWFFGSKEGGIPLYDDQGNMRSGDVTSDVTLWNAGTEVDQEPGVGADTGPKQSAPDQGAVDPDDTVREVPLDVTLSDGSSFTRPATDQMIEVTLTPTGNPRELQVTITNVSTSATLVTSQGTTAIAISPGFWTVGGAFFTPGQKDEGQGLERIAESGNPTDLAGWAAPLTGVITGFSPGVWIVTSEGEPLFDADEPDRGQGLEHLAEAGNDADLSAALMQDPPPGTDDQGTFDTPVGASQKGPLLPGGSYEFTVKAVPGDHLSFATMFGASDDWVFATGPSGIALFDASGTPVSGEVISQVSIWDVGTEQNEELGVGADTGPNQSSPDQGPADPDDTVRQVDSTEYAVPAKTHIRVTLTPTTAQ